MTFVSVIVPCYNEERTIRLLLEGLYNQSYARSDFEIVIADGMSTDRTAAVIGDYQNDHPDLRVRVVVNEKRSIPAGLNYAIRTAQGEVIVRLDAHSLPEPDYIARCVAGLEAGLGQIIGGVWNIQPGGDGWIARSIALAASHPLGVGDALYRYSSEPKVVDTVPFGAFRREVIDRIGYFNESLLTNEDYEFNTRLRQAGGIVWLDPSIRSVYFARASLPALARQYWRYGYWKLRMLRSYPGTVRWRQALPPSFVASLLVVGLAAIWLPLARWLLVTEIAIYGIILAAVGIQQSIQQRDFKLALGIPLAIMVMHLSWGSAFLWSIVS